MTASYEARAATHGIHRNAELKRSLQISRARLTVFLVGCGCVIWTIAHRGGSGWLLLDAALVIVFGVLVAWHDRLAQDPGARASSTGSMPQPPT